MTMSAVNVTMLMMTDGAVRCQNSSVLECGCEKKVLTIPPLGIRLGLFNRLHLALQPTSHPPLQRQPIRLDLAPQIRHIRFPLTYRRSQMIKRLLGMPSVGLQCLERLDGTREIILCRRRRIGIVGG